jgi:uncharacterized protein (DUF1330 family)
MLYVTQLIYIKQGKENIFDEFEQIAIPIIKNYNGRLLLRSRPTHTIESTIDPPYEIHLVEFNTENDLENFMQDEERKKFIHLKGQSIERVVLYVGRKYK